MSAAMSSTVANRPLQEPRRTRRQQRWRLPPRPQRRRPGAQPRCPQRHHSRPPRSATLPALLLAAARLLRWGAPMCILQRRGNDERALYFTLLPNCSFLLSWSRWSEHRDPSRQSFSRAGACWLTPASLVAPRSCGTQWGARARLCASSPPAAAAAATVPARCS